MRIFIGVSEIAGFYTNLQKGFREIGVDSDFVCLSGHPFQYGPGKRSRFVIGWLEALGQRMTSTPRGQRMRRLAWTLAWLLLRELTRGPVFVWALCRYDVFMFRSIGNLLWFLDLPIMKLLGKRIIYVFHGSDARPYYLNGAYHLDGPPPNMNKCILTTRIQKAFMSIINRYADVIICAPSVSHFQQRPIVSSLALGLPFEAPTNSDADGRQDGRLRVVHAPSRLQAKGTPKIRAAVNAAIAAGHDIDYVEIIGQPNAVVLQELQRCDFVIDELYSDSPMPGLVAEAAYFGKPSIICGYYADSIHKDVPAEAVPPTCYVNPDRFDEIFQRMLSDVDYRTRQGERSRAFLTDYWAPAKVAARCKRVIDGDIPADWMYDPMQLRYVHGFGFTEHKLRNFLRQYNARGGRRALHLQDKPELEQAVMTLAQEPLEENNDATDPC